MTDAPTRDRLLTAATELLTASPEVSTRAICERAGVQAPTLYHYFGNKQGLLAAVVEDRFTTTCWPWRRTPTRSRHCARAGTTMSASAWRTRTTTR
ncbi:TetR/AcrR family transcriptional regulator [Actinophytocola glycyrrhizae]|uniref:TetR/AcrR family transcriptional regulator n=1 Tax=Actinophytocola glycyrrhizae TaxID=2044873 RepID=A0ABV9SDS1_9PSEU